jgi:hypothetical protein
MDLSQREFYAVLAEDLAKTGGRSVSLQRLSPEYGPLDASAFVTRARAVIKQFVEAKGALFNLSPMSPD